MLIRSHTEKSTPLHANLLSKTQSIHCTHHTKLINIKCDIWEDNLTL